eukprot:gnl/TRDRNA2_/TRDRNA2_181579_c0_seq1.p1 gnl/TRDRNA2_/TRDRNA2_181579_c0~~gnl/TRDRNA2_/TRDRNA2_181579_c0_seq1.p1  ORF type:complete len:348 (-),score=46.57 gnl/TRDRNA2_/TRDRNA2_181579_c0_seq1:113-1156(-)
MLNIFLLQCLLAEALVVSSALRYRNSSVEQLPVTKTFTGWYAAHETGRGIWKWSNALEAYQRHFAPWISQELRLVEVGVQSGGSMQMWQAVLGSKCHMYGIDINPQANQFADAQTTIVIGDQGDKNMWRNFFPNYLLGYHIDMLVDDGGHLPDQMLTTLLETFWQLNEGGYIAIEDIHGLHYIEEFFAPAAKHLAFFASHKALESVHVYPFLLVVKRSGNVWSRPKSQLAFDRQTVVSSFEELWAVMPYSAGRNIVLQNADWGPFLTQAGLTNFFRHFAKLHSGNWYDTPTGCQHTSASVCTNTVVPTDMQSWIVGIHIYNDKLIVEVSAQKRTIQAVRMGTEWLKY